MVVASRRANLFRLLEIGAAVALAIMVFATWSAFAKTPDETDLLPTRQISILLIGTLVPAMALLVLLGRRLALRRAAGSTARLHVRLVFVFSLIAAVPTLLVATFAGVLFQSGVDFWFSSDSRGLFESTNEFAESYFEQNQFEVAQETRTMAGDMLYLLQGRDADDLASREFQEDYLYQMQARDISESAILQAFPNGTVTTAVAIGIVAGNQPAEAGARALPKFEAGENEVIFADQQRIEAITPIDRAAGIYLYNARNTTALSFTNFQRATDIMVQYRELTQRARALQLRFNLALFFVSLALVGFAVWFALRFADRQVEPLTDLVAAARKVGAGNFALRIEGRTGADEIGLLNRAFNRMTAQLETQTDDLMRANREIDERRAFIEAVLESMSAGIVSIDEGGAIQLMNTSARLVLFEDATEEGRGKAFVTVAPQIAALLDKGVEGGIVTVTKGADLLTLAVRIAPATGGHVITFEDITRQLLDQRRAAWSDVARRIAHEIKNPLTPIQLSAERIRRKFARHLDEEQANDLESLTEVIVRQTGDLRRIVDEFSKFARMPEPEKHQEDLRDLLKGAVLLQQSGQPDVKITSTLPNSTMRADLDATMIGQALTNLIKNAGEATETLREKGAPEGYVPAVHVEAETLLQETEHGTAPWAEIRISDNGIGLPEDRAKLFEPYVTTRDKGTGLGLPIVKKIIEEHGGTLRLDDAQPFPGLTHSGACAVIRLPLLAGAIDLAGPAAMTSEAT